MTCIDGSHNGHMYYLLLPRPMDRDDFISNMKSNGISCTFHYVPLHLSPFYASHFSSYLDKIDLPVTTSLSSRLVRLPLWIGVENCLDPIINSAKSILAP